MFEVELNNKKVIVKVIKFDESQKLAHLEIDGQPHKVSMKITSQKTIISLHNKNVRVELHKYSKSTNPANKFYGAENLSIKSPLTGRITKIFVKTDEPVSKNKPILSIESMKMENEIRAPFDAFVKNILISEGNLVQQNQVLITFEKEGEGNAGKLSNKKILQGG